MPIEATACGAVQHKRFFSYRSRPDLIGSCSQVRSRDRQPKNPLPYLEHQIRCMRRDWFTSCCRSMISTGRTLHACAVRSGRCMRSSRTTSGTPPQIANGNWKGALTRSFPEDPLRDAQWFVRRIRLNKSELLLVLERPEVPLHTNGSERDIRDHVKKQKISGGTRSELGRQCRDTFSSLKKTCRKLGISFWDYLTDRISCSDHIPLLPHLVEQRLVLPA